MDSGNSGTWPHQREKEMRRMQQIDFVAAENPRQLNLLTDGIVFQSRRNLLRIRRVYHSFPSRRHNEQVLVLRGLSCNGFSQALHIPANTGVPDSPQIKSYFHAET